MFRDLDSKIAALRKRADTLPARLGAALEAPAERMAGDAQQRAPWQDQTGRARSGLNAGVEVEGSRVTVYLQHDPALDYPIYLETKYGGRDGIIPDAMTRAIPDLEDTMRQT